MQFRTMNGAKVEEPFEILVGGRGTYADPYRFHSPLLWAVETLERSSSPRRHVLAQIARVRAKLAVTAVTDEGRKWFEQRILVVEYRWYWRHPAYLVDNYFRVTPASYSYKPEEEAANKRAEWLRRAHEAREAFYEFAQTHPDIHAKIGGEVPLIEEMVAETARKRAARS